MAESTVRESGQDAPTTGATDTAGKAVDTTGDLVAGPGTYYRNTRYLMVAILFIFGVLSVRDGFFKYPRENAEMLQLHPDIDPRSLPHPGLDVPFNRVIGVALPPLALGFLAWALYNSRGAYRVSGTTLYVPGHPPVPFINIRKIDRSRWDRKGIALIEYSTPGTNRSGLIRLDDFIYEREGTDKIFERIEAALAQGAVVTTNRAGIPSIAQPAKLSSSTATVVEQPAAPKAPLSPARPLRTPPGPATRIPPRPGASGQTPPRV